MVKPFNRIAATTEGYRGKKALLEERVIEGLEIPSFTGTDLQLTPESAQTQLLTNANLGQYSRIFLPDATLLNNNWQISIINTSNIDISIYYYTEDTLNPSLIKELQKGAMVTFILLDNSTSQGVWTTFRTSDQSASDSDRYKTTVYDSYTLTFSNFIHEQDSDESDENQYSTTKDRIVLSSILSETPIKSIYVKSSEKFEYSDSDESDDSNTLTLSIGTEDDEDKFISDFDLTSTVSNTNFTRDLFDDILSTTENTNLIATVNGTDLTSLTSGRVEIVVERVKIIDPTVLKNSILQTQVPIGTIFNYVFNPKDLPGGYIRLNGTEVPNARNSIPEFVKLLEESDSRSTGQKLVIGLQEWNSIRNTYGSCGKFTWNGTSLRFPSISCFIQGLTDLSKLSTLTPAGLPNITGGFNGSMLRDASQYGEYASGAFTLNSGKDYGTPDAGADESQSGFGFDASRSNPIYGGSTTVQPQSISYPYIISVYNKFVNESTLNAQALISATVEKANTSLDNVAGINSTQFSSALNSANIRVIVETYSNGTEWYRVWNDGWCEQGGYVDIPGSGGASVTFLIPMYDTNYCVYAGAVQGRTTANDSRCFIADRTTTSMTVDWTNVSHIDGTWWEIKGMKAN